jgi:hypothetical protein
MIIILVASPYRVKHLKESRLHKFVLFILFGGRKGASSLCKRYQCLIQKFLGFCSNWFRVHFTSAVPWHVKNMASAVICCLHEIGTEDQQNAI